MNNGRPRSQARGKQNRLGVRVGDGVLETGVERTVVRLMIQALKVV